MRCFTRSGAPDSSLLNPKTHSYVHHSWFIIFVQMSSKFHEATQWPMRRVNKTSTIKKPSHTLASILLGYTTHRREIMQAEIADWWRAHLMPGCALSMQLGPAQLAEPTSTISLPRVVKKKPQKLDTGHCFSKPEVGNRWPFRCYWNAVPFVPYHCPWW